MTPIPSAGLETVIRRLGSTRKAQPFVCRTELAPPPETPRPCVREGYVGKVRIQGNLCPISLRRLPPDEIDALKKSDPDVYEMLVAQNDALGAAAAARRKAGLPPPAHITQVGTRPLRLRRVAAAVRCPRAVALRGAAVHGAGAAFDRRVGGEGALRARPDPHLARPDDRERRGAEPRTGTAAVMIPSDAGEVIKSIEKMTIWPASPASSWAACR